MKCLFCDKESEFKDIRACKEHYHKCENLTNKLYCERCKYDKFKGALVIHFLDGNQNNRDVNNMMVLCLN